MFDSSAYDETRPTPILGCDCDEWASHCWEGKGVLQDYEQAAKWFRKAAEQGHGDSASNLAVCYERGLGVPQDLEQAVYWDRKAAEKGEDKSPEALDRK